MTTGSIRLIFHFPSARHFMIVRFHILAFEFSRPVLVTNCKMTDKWHRSVGNFLQPTLRIYVWIAVVCVVPLWAYSVIWMKWTWTHIWCKSIKVDPSNFIVHLCEIKRLKVLLFRFFIFRRYSPPSTRLEPTSLLRQPTINGNDFAERKKSCKRSGKK